MIPITFGRCFGFLHKAKGDHGIVMCSPFGFEELGTHREWHNLANTFASAGMPTIRFDYEGTNNSLGSERDLNLVDKWISNILEAVDFLLLNEKVEKVSLVGLRLGAALATLAALRSNTIDGLVLLAPVVTGRTYVRELTLLASSWWDTFLPGVEKDSTNEYLDVIGTRIFKATLSDISKIDLRSITGSPARRILIVNQNKRQETSIFAEKLALVNDVTIEPFDGYDNFMRDSVLSIAPVSVFSNVLQWFNAPITNSMMKYGNFTNMFSIEEGKELLVRFGTNYSLFGIITEPYYCTQQENVPAVIILNTGPNHHVGNGRLSVLMARRLALFGVTTLRFDLAGIGDSDTVSNRNSSIYSLDAIEDVKAAITLINANTPSRPIIVFGLCSGAYLALHSMIQDSRISGAIIFNLQRFVWKEGTSLAVGGKNSKRSTKFYMKSLVYKSTWMRILKGKGNVRTTLVTIAKRSIRKLYSRAVIKFLPKSNLANTPDVMVQNWISKLAANKKKVRFWYSDEDPGLIEFSNYFGTAGKNLPDSPHIKLGVVKKADHSLNSYSARVEVINMFETYLHEEFILLNNSNTKPYEDTLVRQVEYRE